MKPEFQRDDDSKMAADNDTEVLAPTSTYKLKKKGDCELKFAKWAIFGGYGNQKDLHWGQAFAFVPHKSLDANSQVTRFTVYKTTSDKNTGSLDFETWVLSSPRPDAIKHLRITPYNNGILISNQNFGTTDVDRAFEVTIVENKKALKLDPELKIKKRDAR